jgi:hypothetical protein
MKIYEVIIHFPNYFINSHYIVQAESENGAIDNVVRDRSLGSADKDDVSFDVKELDLSKPYFVIGF